MSPLLKTCTNKKRYDTRGEAETALRHGRTWTPAVGSTPTLYHCHYCGGFHLCSDRRRAQRR
jgi:hypothetical protein